MAASMNEKNAGVDKRQKTASVNTDPDALNLQSLGLSDHPDGEEIFTDVPFKPLLSNNQYTVRKMAAQAMMDVALMMANISQLRTLLSGGESKITYFFLVVSLVVFSLVSQLVFAILIFIVWVRENTSNQREKFECSIREKQLKAGNNSSAQAAEKLRQSLIRQREHFQYELTTNRLNHVTMALVFLITVINMFITGFGIKPPSE